MRFPHCIFDRVRLGAGARRPALATEWVERALPFSSTNVVFVVEEAGVAQAHGRDGKGGAAVWMRAHRVIGISVGVRRSAALRPGGPLPAGAVC